MLGKLPNLKLVAQAGNGREALEILETAEVDVAILDIDMPAMSGLELAGVLLERTSPPKVILLTMHKNERIFNQALSLGIEHYVLKDEAANGVREAIRCALIGEPYISPMLSRFVLRRRERIDDFGNETKGLERLSPVERLVLKLVAQSRTSKEIGEELGISHRTVGSHRTRISTKLGLSGTHGLMQFALENKTEILLLSE